MHLLSISTQTCCEVLLAGRWRAGAPTHKRPNPMTCCGRPLGHAEHSSCANLGKDLAGCDGGPCSRPCCRSRGRAGGRKLPKLCPHSHHTCIGPTQHRAELGLLLQHALQKTWGAAPTSNSATRVSSAPSMKARKAGDLQGECLLGSKNTSCYCVAKERCKQGS